MLVFCLNIYLLFFFFFKQKTAYEMRISDWSSDVCSSDLPGSHRFLLPQRAMVSQPSCGGSQKPQWLKQCSHFKKVFVSRELRVQIQGHYELQFEAVREAFAALFDDPQERGAALCIQVEIGRAHV